MRARIRTNLRLAVLGGLVVVLFGFSNKQSATTIGASSSPQTVHPYWAGAAAQAQREGHMAYADRSANIQAIMQQMYTSDSRYHTLSALFVDKAPGDQHGSLRVEIRQPDVVRSAVYTSMDGSGIPTEVSFGQASQTGGFTTFFNLPKNIYMTMPDGIVDPHLENLNDVPLGVVASIGSATPIEDLTDGTASSVANMCLHPSLLITSPFFTNKQVTVAGTEKYEGRPAWVLRGQQVPGAISLGVLGDGWRMWVDKQTGLVLALQYYSGPSIAGSALFTNITVDGAGAHDTAAPPLLVVPSNARRVDGPAYQASVAAH